jgi:hypothetical protein
MLLPVRSFRRESVADWVRLLPDLAPSQVAGYAEATTAAAAFAAAALEAARTFRRDHQCSAEARIESWSAAQRRVAALRVHLDAASSGGPPDPRPAEAVTLLDRYGVDWSRTDLVWSLYVLADSSGLWCRSDHRLPAILAARLDAGQLAGLAPVLRAVLHDVVDQHRNYPFSSQIISPALRQDLTRLLATGIDRAEPGPVPAYLLHSGDHLGPLVRDEFAARLTDPAATAVLVHGASLRKPMPSATWRRTASSLPPAARDTASAILDRFAEVGGYLHPDTDLLLRGLTWVLADDAAEAVTVLLARVASTAGSADPASPGYPYAPNTAAAAVAILGDRGGDHATRALTWMSGQVRSRTLRKQIDAALVNLA